MVLPIGAIIGAIGGLGQAGASYLQGKANASAAKTENKIAGRRRKKGIKQAKKGLKEQSSAIKEGKAKIGEQENLLGTLIQLLTGARSNVYGDTTKYIPGRGFITDLSGQTADILGRERNAFLRDTDRAAQASEDYAQTRNKLLTTPKSQAGITSELTNLLALRGGDRNERGKSILGRQALRMNEGARIPHLTRAANEQAGEGLADTLIQGRLGGSKLYQDEEQFRTNELIRQLTGFGNMASSSPKSGLAADITGRQDAAASALGSGVQHTAGQYGQMADFLKTAYPDRSALINALTSTAGSNVVPTDYSWLSKAIGAVAGLGEDIFKPGGTTTVAKTQDRLV